MKSEMYKVVSQNPSANTQQVIFRAKVPNSNNFIFFTKHVPINQFAKPVKLKLYTYQHYMRIHRHFTDVKNKSIACN